MQTLGESLQGATAYAACKPQGYGYADCNFDWPVHVFFLSVVWRRATVGLLKIRAAGVEPALA